MYACQQCLENNWKFKYIDGWILATCQECGFEVEFEAKKKIKQTKIFCKKCNTRLIWKNRNKLKRKHLLNNKSYYSKYRFCPKCKTIYLDSRYKVKFSG